MSGVTFSSDEVHMLALIASHIDPHAPLPDDPNRSWTASAIAAIYKAKATVEEIKG